MNRFSHGPPDSCLFQDSFCSPSIEVIFTKGYNLEQHWNGIFACEAEVSELPKKAAKKAPKKK